jgi:asparagine synthetase B (glutamine-hydrolysing)
MLAGIIASDSQDEKDLRKALDSIIKSLRWGNLKVEEYIKSPYALVKVHSGFFDEESQPHLFEMKGENYLIFFDGKIISVKGVKDEILGKRRDVEILEELLVKFPLEELLVKLNGTFAGVLVNLTRNKVTLFNDKHGTRYLYYGRWKGGLVFSSEVKAWRNLLGFDKQIDWSAALDFFRFGYILGEHTLVSGIRKMNNASIIEYDFGASDFHKTQYWDYSYRETCSRSDKQYFINEFQNRMERAVARCFMRTKGIMGTNLSGGLDTRIILTAVPDSERNRTVGCHYGDQGSLESRLSSQMAKTKGVRWAYVPYNYSKIGAMLEDTVWLGEQGVTSCSVAYLSYATQIFRTDYNVGLLLTGVEGTWLYGGKVFARLITLDSFFEKYWKETNGSVPEAFEKWSSRNGFQYSTILELFKPVASKLDAVKGNALKYLKEKSEKLAARHPANKADYLFLTPNPPNIVGTGVMTRHWLEDLPIMFDDNLVELYLEMPPEYRRSDFRLAVLRKKGGSLSKVGWVRNCVPLNSPMPMLLFMKGLKLLSDRMVVSIRKFTHGRVDLRKYIIIDHFDQDRFFRVHLREKVAEILLSKRTLSRNIYDPDSLKKFVTDYLNFKAGSPGRISILMSFEMWLRMFFDNSN